MKAVIFSEPGGPDVLTVQDIDKPAIESDDALLVKLLAAGVNPIDTKLRTRGTFYPDKMPAVLGCDGAGIVESVGADVTQFKPGDEVFFCNGGLGDHPGCYAEYTIVHEPHAAHKPSSMSFVKAAAAPLVLITAWESLHDHAKLQRGQTVLIHGGAGGVGHVAIQLARSAGAQVYCTVSSKEKADFAQALGADTAINYRNSDFVDIVNEHTHGQGVHTALDTVGGDVFKNTIRAMAYRGTLVTLLDIPEGVDWKAARMSNLNVAQELMLTPQLQKIATARLHQTAILSACAQLYKDGVLTIHLADQFALDDAATAHRLLESGSVSGKIALEMPAS